VQICFLRELQNFGAVTARGGVFHSTTFSWHAGISLQEGVAARTSVAAFSANKFFAAAAEFPRW
jgi:hypothetical protein